MSITRVALLYNPIAGRGRSVEIARRFQSLLLENRVAVCLAETLPNGQSPLTAEIAAAEVICIAGGDGTLLRLIPQLSEWAKPIWLIPTGGECLAARRFGMTAEPTQLLNALKKQQRSERLLAEASDRPFFSMTSFGLDAETIALLSKQRTSKLSRFGYVLPTLRAALTFSNAKLSVSADGKKVIDEESGYFIVANGSEYAGGISFVPEASGAHSENPLLCARFFPNAGIFRNIEWIFDFLLGFKVNLAGTRFFRANEYLVTSASHSIAFQADGEHLGETPVTIRRSSKRLQFLLP